MNQGFSSRQNAQNSTDYGYYVPYGYTNNKSDERLAGGFVFPFLLGGVTGAAVAPASGIMVIITDLFTMHLTHICHIIHIHQEDGFKKEI